MAVAWVYIGIGGVFFYAIPARDLTVDEFAALDADQQALVTTGGLYEAAP
jgi:hypothetical protein